ncbi:DMT family transporter [Bosea sp. (in: a-proteobacteria)]|uniref:DMT family transporter n=1 Tax=Bosea sp. (in: a-proteobacteria) TaxID=1871050 RepID=UPI002FC7D139
MASPPPPRHLFRGILLMLGGIACLAASDAASKLLAATVPTVQIMWIRFVVFAPLAVLIALRAAGGAGLRSRQPFLQVMRGFGLLGSGFGFIAGMQFLPLAQATAVFFVAPLLVILLSVPLLGEVARARQWAAVCLGLIGVLIIVRPGSSGFHPALIFPVISAASWAFAFVMARKMQSDGPLLTLAYSAVVGLIVCTALLPFSFVALGWREIGFGLMTAIFFAAAQLLIILAVRFASANDLAPYAYSQLIWAALFGLVLFGNVPDVWTLIGAVVIVLSGLAAAYQKRGATTAA